MENNIVEKVFQTEEERKDYVEKIIVESIYYNYVIKFLEYGSYYNENKYTIKYIYVD